MTTSITNCQFCGMSHGVRCPSVKAIEYFENGVTVKRVEFMTPSDYYHPFTPWPQVPLNPTFGNTNSYGKEHFTTVTIQPKVGPC
jgi:hypothetical protein